MNALLVAVLLSQAADPALQAEVGPRPAIVVKFGDLIPYDGVLLDDAATLKLGKQLMKCDAEAEEVSKKSLVSTPVLVAVIVGALVAGAGIGAGAAYAATR